MALIYAVVDSEERALQVMASIDGLRRGVSVEIHRGPMLDGNKLPDAATTHARNVVVITAAAGATFAVACAIASATGWIPGVPVGLATAMGALTGVLMGSLGALQAGTRLPKKALREVAAALGDEGRMLTIVAPGSEALAQVLERLETADDVAVGRC